MKEKIEKAKNWVGEHKDLIAVCAISGAAGLGLVLIGVEYGEVWGAYKATVGWMKCMCENPEALAKDIPGLLLESAKK